MTRLKRKTTASAPTGRRRSTITLGAQSYVSHVGSIHSQGNYDWIDENQMTALSEHAIHAALKAAAATSSSSPSDHAPLPPATPRRKSITEFFTRRKQSFARPSEDEYREYDRLQRQHYLLKSARKANVWAPVESPKVIVDSGTGNGIWALEMASYFGQAQVLGIDIRPPPEQQSGPKNLRFVEANIMETWPMADNAVDFIFQRNMGQVIQKEMWPKVLQEMFRVLKPGGYIELVESDLWHHNAGPVQQAFDAFLQEQCKELCLDFTFTETLSQKIEEVGFSKLDHRSLDIPVGEWPQEPELKQFGFINKETQKAFLRNRKHFYVSKWGISVEEYELAVQELLEEFDEYQGFTRFHCWTATKPAA
ncbi:hypothetical protein EC973_009002 [Apophysomyces ossiformis]|uniref:Methyltransferase domain-containing protein n=1 Tax=Apophysomyces ossiformis TaxID=679940 RepID=A0A8H7BW87_9FUNG|nr:hypothetical protein EC973_009002 [Apophysomyces ossiformis]